MPNVSVTIKTNRTQRVYKGDFAFVSVMNEDGVGSRWEQEPVGWRGGLGLFFTGMGALRTVAEQKGREGFKEAARAAMDVLAVFDPDCPQKEKVAKARKVAALMSKTLGEDPGGEKSRKKGGGS